LELLRLRGVFCIFFVGFVSSVEAVVFSWHVTYAQVHSVSKKAKDAIVIKPCVEKVNIPMELDTGSAVSVISHVDYRKYFLTLSLDSTSVTLKTYSKKYKKYHAGTVATAWYFLYFFQ
jgi:hypothetical protein